MNFDKLISEINGFGKFQIQIILIQLMSRVTLPCHFLLNNFMAATPAHRCDFGPLENRSDFFNLTLDQKVAAAVPLDPDGSLSSCRMFSEPQLLFSLNNSSRASTTGCPSGWVFDNSTFRSTLVTEWELVCDNKALSKATATLFFIGVMCGAPLFGFLSDRFGRRPLLLVSYLSSMMFALLSAFSSSYVMFMVMRFFSGVCLAGISIISIVLNVEWCSIERRTLSAIIASLDWTLGNWILVAFAYGVNTWRTLILAVTSPLILSCMAWRWLPESARWLMANGRAEEAHKYILQCAKTNNRSKSVADITPMMLVESHDVHVDGRTYTTLDLFRTTNIRKLAICSGIVWFGVAFTYYGISLNIVGFGFNIYLSQFLFATIEMPMKVGIYFLLEKVGRRSSESGALVLTGLCLLINMFVSKDMWVVRAVVALIGKAFSEASFTIIFLYTTELYPTVVRQNGVGYTSFVARLGVSLSPLIMLLEDVWQLLPSLIYCATAIGSGLVVLLLRETLNAQLPQFIEDIEKPRSLSKRRTESL